MDVTGCGDVVRSYDTIHLVYDAIGDHDVALLFVQRVFSVHLDGVNAQIMDRQFPVVHVAQGNLGLVGSGEVPSHETFVHVA